MITHSLKSLAVPLLLVTNPALPQAHPNRLTLVWQAHCMPFNTMGVSRLQRNKVVIKQMLAGLERSLVARAAAKLPSPRPLLADAQAARQHQPDNELIPQVCKVPSQEAETRVLVEAVNKAKGQRKWGHLPILPPILTPFICHRMLTPT
jgi:hypothetical protein